MSLCESHDLFAIVAEGVPQAEAGGAIERGSGGALLRRLVFDHGGSHSVRAHAAHTFVHQRSGQAKALKVADISRMQTPTVIC